MRTPTPESTPFDATDAALLLSELRRLRRLWHERARSLSSAPAAQAYRQAILDLDVLLEERSPRRRAWLAIRDDVAQAVVDRLQRRDSANPS